MKLLSLLLLVLCNLVAFGQCADFPCADEVVARDRDFVGYPVGSQVVASLDGTVFDSGAFAPPMYTVTIPCAGFVEVTVTKPDGSSDYYAYYACVAPNPSGDPCAPDYCVTISPTSFKQNHTLWIGGVVPIDSTKLWCNDGNDICIAAVECCDDPDACNDGAVGVPCFSADADNCEDCNGESICPPGTTCNGESDCGCFDPDACNSGELGVPCFSADADNCEDCNGESICPPGTECDGAGNCDVVCDDCQVEVEGECVPIDFSNDIAISCIFNEDEFQFEFLVESSQELEISWEYGLDSGTGNNATIAAYNDINIAIIFDNSGSSRNYQEAQQAAIINFINDVNDGNVFSECDSVSIAIIPHGIGPGGHCVTPLSSDPCVSDPVADCICYSQLVSVTDNYADIISFVNGITVSQPNSCSCLNGENNDVGAIGVADAVLSGTENPYLIYITDYTPFQQLGTNDCPGGLCCGIIESQLSALNTTYNVIGVGLGNPISGLACANSYGTNIAWLNSAVNDDPTDGTNVIQVPDPTSDFDLTPLVSNLESEDIIFTIEICGNTYTYAGVIPSCSTECPDINLSETEGE